MTWQLYCLTYELLSPLHIGYHKVGNVQRTRYYIPARNLWAAVTERLTRSGFSTPDAPQGDYQKIGIWVKQHCAFSYFFVYDDGKLLYPHYAQDGLCYGHLSAAEFERRWLSAHVTTALDAATTSAETGSLHEVEFIAPYDDQARRTGVRGWMFLDEKGKARLAEGEWRAALNELQVGGERRYGFGRLRLSDWSADQQTLPDYEVRLNGLRPQINVQAKKPLLAHTLAGNVKARGMIEPLVGRETVGDSRTFGQSLTRGQVCWVPGSVVEGKECLTLDETGVWSK